MHLSWVSLRGLNAYKSALKNGVGYYKALDESTLVTVSRILISLLSEELGLGKIVSL